jgi:DNA-binding response OmpR family regulator
MILTATKAVIVRNQPAKTKGGHEGRAIILVVNDIEETRDGLEELLTSDGYDVYPARNEEDAVRQAKADPPDLILMSLSGGRGEWIAAATRIREKANLKETTPIVLFCAAGLPQGSEVKIERSIYLIRPDNLNQLRECLKRLLHAASRIF